MCSPVEWIHMFISLKRLSWEQSALITSRPVLYLLSVGEQLLSSPSPSNREKRRNDPWLKLSMSTMEKQLETVTATTASTLLLQVIYLCDKADK